MSGNPFSLKKVAHAKFVFCISDFCRSQLMHVSVAGRHTKNLRLSGWELIRYSLRLSSEVEKKADGFIRYRLCR